MNTHIFNESTINNYQESELPGIFASNERTVSMYSKSNQHPHARGYPTGNQKKPNKTHTLPITVKGAMVQPIATFANGAMNDTR